MFKMLDLFSGIGGFSLAASWVWKEELEIISFCECDKFCQKVLRKHWPDVHIFGDIKELYWGDDECEMKDKEMQTLEILHSPKIQKSREELLKNVNTAEQGNLYHQAQQKEDGDFAVENADILSCKEKKDRTQVGVSGCNSQAIQTGKVEVPLSEKVDIKKQKYHSGDAEYSQGTNIPVKNVDISRNKTTTSGHTILRDGQTIQKEDLILKMGEPYARNATKKYTGEGRIDLLTAGVPCQPANCAGKRRGTKDDRWLWGETFRIIREAKPKWVILENVRGILTLEQGVVFENLLLEMESYGYEVQSVVIPACAVNAPHRRDRVWIVANSKGMRFRGGNDNELSEQWEGVLSGEQRRCEVGCEVEGLSGQSNRSRSYQESNWNENWLEVATRLCRVDDGVSRQMDRVNRLKALGNSIVPQIAYQIMKSIKEAL